MHPSRGPSHHTTTRGTPYCRTTVTAGCTLATCCPGARGFVRIGRLDFGGNGRGSVEHSRRCIRRCVTLCWPREPASSSCLHLGLAPPVRRFLYKSTFLLYPAPCGPSLAAARPWEVCIRVGIFPLILALVTVEQVIM